MDCDAKPRHRSRTSRLPLRLTILLNYFLEGTLNKVRCGKIIIRRENR